jgi:hypothetical protein
MTSNVMELSNVETWRNLRPRERAAQVAFGGADVHAGTLARDSDGAVNRR